MKDLFRDAAAKLHLCESSAQKSAREAKLQTDLEAKQKRRQEGIDKAANVPAKLLDCEKLSKLTGLSWISVGLSTVREEGRHEIHGMEFMYATILTKPFASEADVLAKTLNDFIYGHSSGPYPHHFHRRGVKAGDKAGDAVAISNHDFKNAKVLPNVTAEIVQLAVLNVKARQPKTLAQLNIS